MNLPKNAQLWMPGYLRDRARYFASRKPAKRLWVAFTDHYEPCGYATVEVGLERVGKWQERWPEIAAKAPRDSQGRGPVFTFFYPQEEYDRDVLNAITTLTDAGIADVEVHLHHFNDNVDSFKAKMRDFTACLHEQHGLLHMRDGRLVFGFIHGNWALDNSHPAGFGCGVKGELQALRDLGCYADFTMPSLPSPTQSRIVNQIYWTTGDPAQPRGFDQGVEATVGGGRQGDLLMITGPMGLRYRDRLAPRLETGELAAYDSPSADRVKRWLALAPRIGDDIFLKLYGHSAREDNAARAAGGDGKPGTLQPMFEWIAQETAAQGIELNWVSAYEMFSAVDALIQPRGAA